MLFLASAALFSGAGDERVEVESGFAGSCTRVRAAFSSVALNVAVSAARFIKGTSGVAGGAVGWRVDCARYSRGVSCRRASIHGRRSSGRGPGRCDVIILASTPVVVFGFLKASMRWGSSRSGVAMESSSTAAVGVGSTAAVRGVFWRFRETQALRSSLYFLFFSRAFVLDGWDSCPRILFLRICVCMCFCTISLYIL